MKLLGGGKENFQWDKHKKEAKDVCNTNLVKKLIEKKHFKFYDLRQIFQENINTNIYYNVIENNNLNITEELNFNHIINRNLAIISFILFQRDDCEFLMLFAIYKLINNHQENDKIRRFKFEYIISDEIIRLIELKFEINIILYELDSNKIYQYSEND